LATLAGVTQWDFKLPSFMLARTWGNLFLAAIPEEGFYRGFLQKGLSRYFGNTKKGKTIALFLTSILFTFAHVYWSPDIALLGFVFLASLLND
jgi:membrane protease YdiL (CAAX protease family)